MAAERVSMRKLREVVRLRLNGGMSGRAIARSCDLSPATVSIYLGRIAVAKLTWPLAPGLDDDEVRTRRNSSLPSWARAASPASSPPSARTGGRGLTAKMGFNSGSYPAALVTPVRRLSGTSTSE